MKRSIIRAAIVGTIIGSIFGAFLALSESKLDAQTTIYPRVVFVVWDLNPPSDEVTNYTVTHNNGVSNVILNVPIASCDTTCRQSLSVPGATPQTVSVTATNQWGTSSPVSVTFTVRVPGNSRNIQIRSK